MVTRTFITKSSTIFKDSNNNFGLNPVCQLQYGKNVARVVIQFDEAELVKGMDGKYLDRAAVKHTLKMTNCASLDPKKFWEKLPSNNELNKMQRATSFKLIFFEVPKKWDAGVGFDNSLDIWFVGKNASSTEGINWFQSKNGVSWSEGNEIAGHGMYDNEVLENEYNRFLEGKDSIIIAEQDFDFGNEDISVDITNFVNDVIDGKKINNGIGISFVPYLEKFPRLNTQYVGFFNNNTNTFFRPFVETRYSENLMDDRYTFVAGRVNRLYCDFGEKLDLLPTCEVNGLKWPVKMASDGIYYAEVKLPRAEYKKETILYDVWSSIVVNNEVMEDVENEFVVHPFSGTDEVRVKSLEPSLSGINDGEKIYQGDSREVCVYFLVKNEYSEYELSNLAEYRLYVLDGDREVTVIDWDGIQKLGKENFFIIDTGTLVPQEYIVDIRVSDKREKRTFKKALKFRVVDILDEYRK